MTSIEITQKVDVDPQELWEATFGSSFEVHEWWVGIEYVNGADWDKPGVAHLEIDDPEQPGRSCFRDVDMDRLLWAVAKATAECRDACTGNAINPAKGEVDFDACVGDCILQIAVLGEVVYG